MAGVRIQLNGEPTELPAGLTVAGLLERLGVPNYGVAVERNRQVVRRADHAGCVLEDGDQIEVVQFVGGG
jgi:sulfur carrier protein